MEWLQSKECERMIASSPTFPCRECLRLNMRAEGAPGKPMCSPPKEKPDARSKYLTKEEKEWLDWDSRIDSVFGMIEKATIYYEARLHGATAAKRLRRARKKAARLMAENVRKVESLTERARRAYRGGMPSKAEALMAEARELQATLRNGTMSNHEEESEEGQAQEAGA